MFKFARICAAFLFVFCLFSAASAATLTVTKIADTNDGACDTDCSLREAINAANASGENDTIVFSTLFATPQTITLSGTDLQINNAGTLAVNGPGADRLTVSGGGASRVFTNNTGAVTTISNLTVTGGNAVSSVQTGRGGGVYNNGGTLTLSGLVIFGNTAANGGGANNAGTATLNVVNTAIFNNTVTGAGGALQNFSGNATNIINSSIYGNTCNSTLTGGGAIQANGTVNIINSTMANNRANGGDGGAIYFNGQGMNITNSTISGNISSTNGGGIHRTNTNPFNVRNSIVAGNTGAVASPDVTGAVGSQGNNIIGNVGTSTGWTASDLQNTDPRLAPLGFYGGNGLTFALLATSPALDAGQNCVTDLTCPTANPPAAIATDQRGAARPFNSTVDIGSFESNAGFVALLPNAVVNQSYNQSISPNVGSFTFSATGGSLPAGITVNTGAIIASVAGTPTETGIFNFVVTVTNNVDAAAVNYRLKVFTDAASVPVSGRVTDASGKPVKNAVVYFSASDGARAARTNNFGRFVFENVPVGETLTFNAAAKGLQFDAQTIEIVDAAGNLNFTAET